MTDGWRVWLFIGGWLAKFAVAFIFTGIVFVFFSEWWQQSTMIVMTMGWIEATIMILRRSV